MKSVMKTSEWAEYVLIRHELEKSLNELDEYVEGLE